MRYSWKHLAACLSIAILLCIGCEKSDLQETTPDVVEETTPEITQLLEEAPKLLSAEEVSTIRESIEASAGTLELDDAGQPIAIDLAVARGSANQAAFDAALQCENLTKLRLAGGQISAEDVTKIACFTQMEDLYLQDAAIDDATLEAVFQAMPNLSKVGLRNLPNVTDRAINALTGRQPLTHLTLLDMKITGKSLETAASCPKLASLDLRMCNQLSPEDLSVLADCSSLRELKIAGAAADDAAIPYVVAAPSLDAIVIEDATVTSDGLGKLTENQGLAARLRAISIARTMSVDDTSFGIVADLPNLRTLSLKDQLVTGSFLADLAAPEKLETLLLVQTYIDDAACESVAQCENLKRLDLSKSMLTPESIEKIASLPNLETLNLAECSVDDMAIAPLAECKSLTSLTLNDNYGVGDDSIEMLKALPNLQTLNVEGTGVSAEAIEAWKNR